MWQKPVFSTSLDLKAATLFLSNITELDPTCAIQEMQNTCLPSLKKFFFHWFLQLFLSVKLLHIVLVKNVNCYYIIHIIRNIYFYLKTHIVFLDM